MSGQTPTGDQQDQVPHTSCILVSGTRCGGLLQADLQGRRHGEQRKPVPGSAPRAKAATAPASSARVDGAGLLVAGRRRRWRARSPDRKDGLRVVRRTEHSGKPGSNPEVVLGYLPAPRVGAGQGRGLGPVRGEARRAARRGPRTSGAHPPRLAHGPRRARRPAQRRSCLRPRPPWPRPGTGARGSGLRPARPHDRRPYRALTCDLQ